MAPTSHLVSASVRYLRQHTKRFRQARFQNVRSHRYHASPRSMAAGSHFSSAITTKSRTIISESIPSETTTLFYPVQHRFHSTVTAESDTEEEEELPRFEEMPDLHPSSKIALKSMGLEQMTEIQAKTWHPVTKGRDVLGRARTGTGKTLAFLLPSIERIVAGQDEQPENKIRMLVLSPTRELALQIAEQTRALLNAHNRGKTMRHSTTVTRYNNVDKTDTLVHQVMLGGSSRQKDVMKLNSRLPDILVATPGRLQDHLQNTLVNNISFASLMKKQVEILVLDETDRLLDMGFRNEVETILSCLPTAKQTLLFSATLPPGVRSVLKDNMKPNFETVDCIHEHDSASHVNAQVTQSHVILPYDRAVSQTIDLILNLMQQNEQHKIIVFFPTTHLVQFYSNVFNSGLGMSVLEIHSKKSQSYRTSASNRFREVKRGVLFTTDVSARGVDYPNVTHVVQVGMSETREAYIHRLGRTGRAGKVGQGILVLTNVEKRFIKSQLRGLDIPVNKELQDFADTWQTRRELVDQLEPIWTSIRKETSPSLVRNVHEAYRSMLGFYSARLAQVGVHSKEKLVNLVNSFAVQVGLTEPPPIRYKTARNMGLAQVRGLNIGSTMPNDKKIKGKRPGGRGRSSRRFQKDEGGGPLLGGGSYGVWGRSKDISNKFPLPESFKTQ